MGSNELQVYDAASLVMIIKWHLNVDLMWLPCYLNKLASCILLHKI